MKMFKIPKQEYTTEFKNLAVKRVQGCEGIAKAARELGLVEQTLRNWVKTAKNGKLIRRVARPSRSSRWSSRGYTPTPPASRWRTRS
jgi:transposase-like protein